MRVLVDGAPVELLPEHWVGEGGEGAVYARDGVAYKLFADPTRVLPAAKLVELGRIASPRVIIPRRPVLDAGGTPIGHTLRFLPNAEPLCRLFTRTYRERVGVDDARIPALVDGLAETVRDCHRAGVTIVDLHESNALVDPALAGVYLIDADSFETPGFPATAQLDAIRDRHATRWSAKSDWFAFAVLAFNLFVGVHPYRGTHPTLATLDARMLANASAFDPLVKLPATCFSLAAIPPGWRPWLEGVLQHGRRDPPSAAPPAPFVLASCDDAIASTDQVDALPFCRLPEPVHGVWSGAFATAGGVYVDGRRVLTGRFDAIGRSPGGTLVGARIVAGRLDLGAVPCGLRVVGVTAANGRIVALCGDRLVEVELIDVGGRVVAGPRVLGTVMPLTTQLWPGCAVEQVHGRAHVSVFPRPGTRERVAVPALDGRTVVGAVYDRGVFVAVFANRDRYDRVLVQLDRAGVVARVRVDVDVDANVPDLAVLDSGVAVLRVDETHVAAFQARGGADVRVLRAPAGRLFAHGSVLLAVRGRNAHRLVTRAGPSS